MKSLLLLLGLVMAGCIVSQPTDMYVAPKLIDQESFPALPNSLQMFRQDFHMKLQIATDGTVLNALLDHWSGDSIWDSSAVHRIKHWKFSPGMYNGTPVKLWVDLHTCVKNEDPIMMSIEEIMCPTRQIADSVYALLRSGSAFETLALQFSIAPSQKQCGRLGEIDIHRFPDVVHNALIGVPLNEYTHPLAVGTYYCLYKRVARDMRVP